MVDGRSIISGMQYQLLWTQLYPCRQLNSAQLLPVNILFVIVNTISHVRVVMGTETIWLAIIDP